MNNYIIISILFIINYIFQVHCMKFLNSLLTSSPDGNSRISLQSEIEMAGLDVKSLLKVSAVLRNNRSKCNFCQPTLIFYIYQITVKSQMKGRFF